MQDFSFEYKSGVYGTLKDNETLTPTEIKAFKPVSLEEALKSGKINSFDDALTSAFKEKNNSVHDKTELTIRKTF